jgi:hypothetical protein
MRIEHLLKDGANLLPRQVDVNVVFPQPLAGDLSGLYKAGKSCFVTIRPPRIDPIHSSWEALAMN